MKSFNRTAVLLSVTVFVHGLLFNNRTAVAESTDNITQTAHVPETQTFWCPKGLQRHNLIYYCKSETASDLPWDKLTSCLNISSKDLSKGWESRCENFTDEFLTCEKKNLGPGLYTVDITGKGIKDENGLLLPIGSFYINVDHNAIVCGAALTPCKPLPSELVVFSYIAENGSVVVANLSIVLNDTRYFTKNSDNQSIEHVCIQLSKFFTECRTKIPLALQRQAWIQKDFILLTDLNEHVKFDSYLLLKTEDKVAYCLPTQPSTVIEHVYAGATIASVFFLLLTLVLHHIVPIINTQNKPLLCHMLSLTIAYTALIIIQYYSFPSDGTVSKPAACITVYIFFHVFILAAFLWLNVTAFQLWRVFRRPGIHRPENNISRKTFFLNCLYAFGIPIVVCAITLAINWSEPLQELFGMNPMVNSCMLNKRDKSMLVLLYVPMSIILLGNILMFGLIVYNFVKAGSVAKLANNVIYKQLLHVSIKLFFVMGICWTMEIISFLVGGDDSHWYFTDIINGLQGMFTFIVYVFKTSTFEAIREKFSPGSKKAFNKIKIRKTKLRNVATLEIE